jgi:hypothetical protein
MRKLIRVYRMEHKVESGFGPFTGSSQLMYYGTARFRQYSKAHRYPNPEHDSNGRAKIRRGQRCGVSSLAQLDHWFPPNYRKMLEREGFVVRSYVLPKESVTVLPHQVLFFPGDRRY